MSKPPITGKPVWREEHERVATLLRQAREKAGMSLTDVGAKMGRPATYVSKLERNKQSIDVIELIDYCRAVGISPSDLLGELEG